MPPITPTIVPIENPRARSFMDAKKLLASSEYSVAYASTIFAGDGKNGSGKFPVFNVSYS